MIKYDPYATAIQAELDVRLARAERTRIARRADLARTPEVPVAQSVLPRAGWLRRLSDRFRRATTRTA